MLIHTNGGFTTLLGHKPKRGLTCASPRLARLTSERRRSVTDHRRWIQPVDATHYDPLKRKECCR